MIKEKIEVLGGQPVKGPLCPPQIPDQLFGNITLKQLLVIQCNENRVLCNKIIYNR
jgi:hypothetical protein